MTNILMKEMAQAVFMVSLEKGELIAKDGKGNDLWIVGLDAGVHEGRKFVKYLTGVSTLEVSKSVGVILNGKTRLLTSDTGKNRFESGSNPDFVPTSATAQEMRMRKMLIEANATEKRMDRKAAGLKKVAQEAEKAAKDRKEAQEQAEKEEAERKAAEAAKKAAESAAVE